MCEARGLPATRIGVVDEGSDESSVEVQGQFTISADRAAEHVGGCAARSVRVRAPANTKHPLLVWAWGLIRLDFVGVGFGTLFFCLSLTPSLLPQGLAVRRSDRRHQRGDRLRDRRRRRKGVPPLRLSPQALVAAAKRVLNRMKVATDRAGGRRQRAGADPRRRMAASGLDADGHRGTGDAGLPAHAGPRGCSSAVRASGRRGWCSTRSSCWPARSSGAGTCITRSRSSSARAIVVVLLITADQRRAVPRLPGRRQPGVPAAELHHPGRRSPTRPSPNGQAAQRHSRHGTRSAIEGRNFVATGPDLDALVRVNGRPAKEPIRVYAGLQTADTDAGPDGRHRP